MTTPQECTDKMILLVEDTLQDEKLTLRAFKKANLLNPIVIARDGEEALKYLLSTSPTVLQPLPQLLLLDLSLPKLTGLEVLQIIRDQPSTQYLPTVILTSSDAERDIVESYKLGANGYVRKPISFQTFVEAIEHLGLFWLVLNQTPAHPETPNYA